MGIRSRTAAAVVALGVLATAAPSVIADALALFPGLGGWPDPAPLRRWGVAYAVLGVLTEWHRRRGRRVGPRRAGIVACVAALALFAAHLATGPGFAAAVESFSWSVAVVVPFVAGTPRSAAGRSFALGLLALPIAATRLAIEPIAFAYVVPPLAQASYPPLVAATFGFPLFALGGVAGTEPENGVD